MSLLKNILDILIPPTCHVCGAPLHDHEDMLCTGCIAALPRTGFANHPDNQMYQTLSRKTHIERAASFIYYTRGTDGAGIIHRFKYRNLPDMARLMGMLAGAETGNSQFLQNIDYIVPLPVHYLRRMKRGYNQTEYFAEGVSKATGIPVLKCLHSTKPHKSQAHAGHNRSLEITPELYRVSDIDKIKGKHLLVVDDVFTTGTTIAGAILAITSLFREPDVDTLFPPEGIRVSAFTLASVFQKS